MEREEHRERPRISEQAIRGSHQNHRLLGALQFPGCARKTECSKLQLNIYYFLKHLAGKFSSAHAYVQNCSPRMYGQIALNQADLMGHLIAEEMSSGDMVTLLKLRKGQFSLVEEKVDTLAVAAGKTVRELNLPVRCVLVTIIRKGELNMPHGDFVLQPDDEVLAVVHAENAIELAGLLGKARSSIPPSGAGPYPSYACVWSVSQPLMYAGLSRSMPDSLPAGNEQL